MKRIIVCCDGTWNAPEKLDSDSYPTNVLRLCRTILPSANGVTQTIAYVAGIGTGTLADRFAGGLSAKGISSNILQGYRFISNNFDVGDHIFLFGFSRGAYTARLLSGFIYYFGIIKKQFQGQLPYLFDLYQRFPKEKLPELVRGYEDKLNRDLLDRNRERPVIPIQFLGVWDTVGSLGVPLPFFRRLSTHRIGFHDTELAQNVDFAYHALAIHEYRKKFPPTLWTEKQSWQTVEQVWFPGAHSDVGGGLHEVGLSNAALLWMAGRAKAAGLAVDEDVLKRFTPRADTALSDSRRGIYKLFPRYARPIGSYCDRNKPKSLNEFRHQFSADIMTVPTYQASRTALTFKVDSRSAGLPMAPAPNYI